MAFFTNQGYAECYYPNGKTRLHLDLCSGSSFDVRGFQQKCWNWWDTTRHVHAPPFQPISIQFNVYIQVKIQAQDQIFLNFTNLHSCIRLNVGARLKLKDPAMLPLLKSSGNQKPSISQARIQRIKMLLGELRKGLKPMPSAPNGSLMHLDTMVVLITRLQRWHCKKLFEPKQ
uniref:Uncharacterized protein n=2 Tax=Sphaerodactylus townsendi TaxID=933632 RepID=A0ACB8F7H6_9SAUR